MVKMSSKCTMAFDQDCKSMGAFCTESGVMILIIVIMMMTMAMIIITTMTFTMNLV